MLRNRAATILIAGLILCAGTMAMAQSAPEITSPTDPSASTAVSGAAFSMDRDLTQPAMLFCMNIDRERPPITRKRLALDPSIQELRWVAAHGPRQEMLESFLSRQARSEETVEAGQMARVGGTVASWSDIVAGEREAGLSPVSIGHLDLGLIGPDSARR